MIFKNKHNHLNMAGNLFILKTGQAKIVLASVAHIPKLERYREDTHGPYIRMMKIHEVLYIEEKKKKRISLILPLTAGLLSPWVLHRKFCIPGFNQQWIKNISQKKNPRNFQKAKLKFVMCQALHWIHANEAIPCRSLIYKYRLYVKSMPFYMRLEHLWISWSVWILGLTPNGYWETNGYLRNHCIYI